MRYTLRPKGFSLIEILAVLALMAIMVSAVAFSFSKSMSGAKVKASAKDLVAALRFTRGQAIIKGEEKAVAINVDGRSYQIPGKDPVALPDGLEMKLLTAEDEITDDGIGRIRFYPDGSSTGGRVTLIRDRKEWRIDVAWLTGEVRLEEGRE